MLTQELQYWDNGLRLRGLLACAAAPAARHEISSQRQGLGTDIETSSARIPRLASQGITDGQGTQPRVHQVVSSFS